MPRNAKNIKMYYPKSKNLRLPGYDYSQPGWYFITLTTRNRSCLFGHLENDKIALTNAGYMIEKTWQELPRYFRQIELDTFQVMPDHFHGILIIKSKPTNVIEGDTETSQQPVNSKNPISLITLMERFKSITTNRYIQGVKQNGWQRFSKKLWEFSFHDHVIRNESSLRSVREYIHNNIRKWELERLGIAP